MGAGIVIRRRFDAIGCETVTLSLIAAFGRKAWDGARYHGDRA